MIELPASDINQVQRLLNDVDFAAKRTAQTP